MIRPDKYEDALRALNMVLVCARRLAYEKADHDQIADVLDAAEELPTLFLRKEDLTEYFRDSLVDLAARHAGFGLAVEAFDGRVGVVGKRHES